MQHLDQRMLIIERRAQIHVLGHEFAIAGRGLLPFGSRRFPAQPGRTALPCSGTSGAQFRVKREIDDLAEKEQRQ